jgi:carbonic anhydrase
MSRLEEILAYNREFVQNREYEPFVTDKYPNKKLVIVTCMDTRLTELLPRALNLKNGDAKILKTAGALISNPYGSIMRSVLVAVTLLNAEEVLVIGHLDCGMVGLEASAVLDHLKKRGMDAERFEEAANSGVDLQSWLKGCHRVEDGVLESVRLIRNHPMMPEDVRVHGLTIDPVTGELNLIDDGGH